MYIRLKRCRLLSIFDPLLPRTFVAALGMSCRSEIDCCAGRSRDELVVGQQQQPAGLCVFTNENINLNTPSSDTEIDGVFVATW